jgi:hypothetical protein
MSQPKFEKISNALAAKQLADLSRKLGLPSYADVTKIAVAELWNALFKK